MLSNFFNELKKWFKCNSVHILSVFIFVVYSQIVLYPTLYENKDVLAKIDIQQHKLRMKPIEEARKKYKQKPLWNPNVLSGQPILKKPKISRNFFSRTFFAEYYPSNFIEKLFSKDASLYIIMCLGMYLLMLSMKFKWYIALASAILYGYTTNLMAIIASGHDLKFQTLACIPWIFWGWVRLINWMDYSKTWKSDFKSLIWTFFILTASISVAIYSRHPQIMYIFFYVILFWGIYEIYKLFKNKRLSRLWIGFGVVALAVIIAVINNFGYLWDIQEYASYSMRAGSVLRAEASGGVSKEYAFGWSHNFWEFLSLFIPELYGGTTHNTLYWGGKPTTRGPHYIGAITLLLIIFAWVWCKKRGILKLFTAIAVFTILFSAGSNVPFINHFMHDYAPLFNRFRAPETWLYITVFCTSIMAAYGIQSLCDFLKKKRSKNITIPRSLYIPIGSVLLFGLFMLLLGDSLFSFKKDGELKKIAAQAVAINKSASQSQLLKIAEDHQNNQLVPKRKEVANSSINRFFILNLLIALIIGLVYIKRWSPNWLVISILVIISWDMVSISNKYANFHVIPKREFQKKSLEIENKDDLHLQYIKDNIDSGKNYPYRGLSLTDRPFKSNKSSAYFPSVGGYNAAKLSIYQDILDHLLVLNSTVNERLLSMLNTKYIVNKTVLSNWKPVFKYKHHIVQENPNVLPKAFFVDNIEVVSTPQEAMERLKSNIFDPEKTAIVEHDQPIPSPIKAKKENIKITRYEPNRITFYVNRDQPGFVVLSEIYYPNGWKAYLDDGKEIPIYKTNYILRGVEVPAGKHKIGFNYLPDSQKYGGMVSNIGRTVFMILFWGYLLFIISQSIYKYYTTHNVKK